MKQPAVYIVTNQRNGTLYTGVTSNLPRRIFEHRESVYEGFTKKYGCKHLVFYAFYDTMKDAIKQEKRIKRFSRKEKLLLIEKQNPSWNNLEGELF